MNIIALTGNSTKEVALKYTPGGAAIGSGTIAVRRDFKNKQTGEYETDFINFTAFGKTAEIMADYIKKGDKFGISGRLQIRTYEQDGQRKYFTEVVVNSFDFPDRKSEGNQGSNQQRNNSNQSSAPTDDIDSGLPF